MIAVLGRNPITGEEVPRNAETLIGGFMRLIGQEEVWTNLQRARAVERAWAWFQGALSGLLNFVSQIPTLFVQALRSLELMDIVLLPRAFVRVGSVFANFAGQFITWAGEQVFSLLQIIFEVLAPLAMPYIRRTSSALRTIFRDPIGFIGNLVRAGIQGFRQFGSHFLTHLRASLIGWLTGAMSGANIYIPQGFNFREIVKFVLSVLGLTWQNIRTKLVRAIGETAVRALETGFQLVVTLVTQGPAAAWEQIQQGISNLREMVMEQIMTFVRDRIVTAAITRLVTSLNPAGAFIQAVIAIYNTVMFFVERLRQITQVAMSFIDSMAAIASGNITAAANRVEQTMAGLLTLVISFLARLVGLGRVSDAVTNVVNRIRAPIDRALDRVVEWIRARAQALLQRVVGGTPQQRLDAAMTAALAAVNRFHGRRVGELVLRPVLAAIRLRYGLRALNPVRRGNRWAISGEINPVQIRFTPIEVEDVAAGNVPQADRERLAAKIIELKANYRERLSRSNFRDHLGWCFEYAATLGLTTLENPSQGVEVYLVRFTPRRPRQRLRPAAGRSIEGETVDDPRWVQHVVVTVNGRVFDYEFNVQGTALPLYVSRMFPDQNPIVERADRVEILAAAASLAGLTYVPPRGT